MLKVPAKWEITQVPADDERLALAERILASDCFHRASQLRNILVYIVARSLSQNSATITEQQIGSVVLGRGPDFDPGHDNIVRAQMRHLRFKLEQFFEKEGKDEPLILTIPKGHYVANFRRRPTGPRSERAAGVASSVGSPPDRRRRGRLWTGLAFALLSLTVVLLLVRSQESAATGTVPEKYSFYANVLGPKGESETSLVLGNPIVILYAGSPSASGEDIGAIHGIPVPPEWRKRLKSAANRADWVMPHHLLQVKKNDYTGLGDATGCFRLGQLMNALKRPTSVTQARFLSWDSARSRNLIILGSPHTNDWAYGNVPNHNFRIVKMGIRNQNPGPGEPDLYRCVWNENGTPISDYGLIWSWRTPSGSRVLVLAGPSSAATGAMATLFSSPDDFRPIYEKLLSDTQGHNFPENWQVLFKVAIRDNLPVRTTYVTHRIYPSDS